MKARERIDKNRVKVYFIKGLVRKLRVRVYIQKVSYLLGYQKTMVKK